MNDILNAYLFIFQNLNQKSKIMKNLKITIVLNTIIIIACADNYCNIPDKCEIRKPFNFKSSNNTNKYISCVIQSGSTIGFTKSTTNVTKINKKCKSLKEIDFDIYFKTSSYNPLKFHKNAVDFKEFLDFISNNSNGFVQLEFHSFKGFDIDLFDQNYRAYMNHTLFTHVIDLAFIECIFEFYQDEKRIETCEEMSKVVGLNGPKSIFQLPVFFLNSVAMNLVLREYKTKICPLAFKNFKSEDLSIIGYNSFYSRRILVFSNETFSNLNSNINMFVINIPNVNIDLNLINPSIFGNLPRLDLINKVNSIQSDLFLKVRNISTITIEHEYFRSLIHNGGIEWIRNINKELKVNISDSNDLKRNFHHIKYINIQVNIINNYIPPIVSIVKVFPEEDFCLYKDFPFYQLVYIIKTGTDFRTCSFQIKFTCTFLYLIQYHEKFLQFFDPNLALESYYLYWTNCLLDLVDSKSLAKCNFEQMLNKCNKTEFAIKPISTKFELAEQVIIIKSVILILSYLIAIFGIVTNILVIITISSKENKAEFKGLKQYNYLRIYSIINCFILLIYLTKWVNRCEFPYQVFCPLIRKELFFQYFKLIVQEVIYVSLQFLGNFIYVAFAFNRISLIGKDHNKLVKFMSDVGIKKYTAISLLISVGLSVIKLFSYRINYGQPNLLYPIDYNEVSFDFTNINLSYFIINSISDLLNYCVFIFVHLFIDIGMVIKLRETLKAKLERLKSMYSKDDQEKKRIENETAVNNAISMVALNSSISFLLKSPICAYSLLMLVFNIEKINDIYILKHPFFYRFYNYYCIQVRICGMSLHFFDFLYLLSITIPFFFYKHFDKKIKCAFERKFSLDKNKNFNQK